MEPHTCDYLQKKSVFLVILVFLHTAAGQQMQLGLTERERAEVRLALDAVSEVLTASLTAAIALQDAIHESASVLWEQVAPLAEEVLGRLAAMGLPTSRLSSLFTAVTEQDVPSALYWHIGQLGHAYLYPTRQALFELRNTSNSELGALAVETLRARMDLLRTRNEDYMRQFKMFSANLTAEPFTVHSAKLIGGLQSYDVQRVTEGQAEIQELVFSHRQLLLRRARDLERASVTAVYAIEQAIRVIEEHRED